MSTFESKLNSNTSLAVQGALANHLQRRADFKTQNGLRGLERGPTLGLWASEHLSLNKFLDRSIPSIRNVDDGEKKERTERIEW